MQFQLLGSIELWSAGQSYELGPAKEQCVLANLLLQPRMPVAAGVLIDRVWDENPPPKAREALSAYVTRVRHRLRLAGGDQAWITMRSGGYVLDLDPEAVDLHRFYRLRRQADAMNGSGDSAHAALLLREADALWRGQALAGLPGDAMARLRRGLEEERRASILERIRIELGLGRHADLVGELHRLSAEYPLDEVLATHRLTALYRCGRLADALNVYLEIRDRLIGEQGIEPGPELAELHQRILRRDSELAITPAYRQEGHAPQPSTLPPGAGDFVGRTAEIQLMTSDREHPHSPQIKVIEGMPGVGKTALAVQVAHRMTHRYPDSQLYLDFHAHDPGHPTVDPADALHRLLHMLHIPVSSIPRTPPERSELWRSELVNRRAVIILDDVPGSEEIRPLLPAAGDCLILVTTRRRLHGLDGADAMILEPLPESDAITLFTLTAGPDIIRDDATVAKAVRLCGLLPLAIRVTASRLRHARSSGLADLVEELARSRDRPGHADVVTPQVTSAFELSYEGLTLAQQRLFRRLGLSPCPSITLHAAVALGGGALTDTEVALTTLLDHHLLERATATHVRFHDLTRAYATIRAARDESEADRRRTVGRLLDYYVHTADRANRILHPHRRRITTPDIRVPLAVPALDTAEAARGWLESEWRNILQAARDAAKHEWKRYCADLVHLLGEFMETSGYWDEAITAHTLALQACRDLDDPQGTAQSALELSLVSLRTGHYETALRHAEEAAAIHRCLADRSGEAAALDRIGMIHRRSAHFRKALAYHVDARELYLETGDLHGVAEALCHAGSCYSRLGRYPEAITHFDEALALYRQVGDRRGEAKTLNNRGGVQRNQGYHRDAMKSLQDSLRIFQDIGGRQYLAMLRHNIGCIHQYKGHHEEALAEYRRALTTFRDTGDLRSQADVLNEIGIAYHCMELHSEALVHHHRAQSIAEEIGESHEQAVAQRGMADAYRGSGYYDEALEHYKSALRLAWEIGDPYQEAKILNGVAETMLRTSGREAARPYWRQALDLFQQLGVPEAESVRIRLYPPDAAAS
jgi:tetratricopeptide (TPR) repeat protein/DNA-binding SARP family transcriptional activator